MIAVNSKRPPCERVTLQLPVPPSVNRLHIVVGGKPIRSPAYRRWIAEAGWSLLYQRPGRVSGPYTLTMQVCAADTRADLGNLEKAISDLLQSHGVIDNDCKASDIRISWGGERGCAVTVEAVRA